VPLRDHFRPPVSKHSSWEGFHGGWPMVLVQKLAPSLPERYVAEPRVHLGTFFEIDVCTFEDHAAEEGAFSPQNQSNGEVAAATWEALAPTLTVDVDIPDPATYEVLIFDLERDRQLVAAVEIVSPANKDRPECRQVFIAKCTALLQQQVCVSIVDLVTVRRFNLYTELLALLQTTDPSMSPNPPPIYAATCRKRNGGSKGKLDTWASPLAVGQPLPALPIWLSPTLGVSLDLEAAYEETCRALRIV
jgi:Protein of unknown function (DUF4058)